jgi:hypothetical protein
MTTLTKRKLAANVQDNQQACLITCLNCPQKSFAKEETEVEVDEDNSCGLFPSFCLLPLSATMTTWEGGRGSCLHRLTDQSFKGDFLGKDGVEKQID